MSTFASQSADILVIIKTIKNLNHSDAVPQLIKNHYSDWVCTAVTSK